VQQASSERVPPTRWPFWLSYDLNKAAQVQDWPWMAPATSYLLKEAVIPADALARE